MTDELNCTCCPAIVECLWKRQLPSQVRAGIAHIEFSKANFDRVTQLADDIFQTNPAKSISAIAAPAPSLDETQPGLQYPVPEVAAVRGAGGRGRSRGGRSRGGRGQGRGGAQPQPRHTGTKHPDLPAGEWRGCGMHFKFGRGAFFCSDPSSCPWKDVYTAKPAKQ